MQNFQKLFTPTIWKRGQEYFKDESVSPIVDCGNGCYEIEVEGSYTYYVNIEVRNNKILYMDCDCPYAETGNHCKHMAAAVLKMLDEQILKEEDTQPSTFQENKDQWTTIINNYGAYKKRISDFRESQMDREISDNLNSLTNNLFPQTSQSIVASLTEAIQALEGLSDNRKMPKTMSAMKKTIIFLKESYNPEIDITSWGRKTLHKVSNFNVFFLFISLFLTNDQESITIIDRLISENNMKKNTRVISVLIKKKIEIMLSLHYAPSVILENLHPFRNYEVVINYEIDYLIQTKEYQKAAEKITQLINNIDLSTQVRLNYQHKLEDLYIEEKNIDKYQEFIISKFNTVGFNEVNSSFEKLKTICSKKEWKQVMDNISYQLSAQYPNRDFSGLYYTMKEYSALLSYIYSNYDIYSLVDYQEEIYRYNPELYLHMCCIFAISIINEAKTEYELQSVYEFLRKNSNLPEYEDIIKEVILYCRKHYPEKEEVMARLLKLIDQEENEGDYPL